MDTPDRAASFADARVADAVNKEWLVASAQSSQLSTDLKRYNLDWSLESDLKGTCGFYGATGTPKTLTTNKHHQEQQLSFGSGSDDGGATSAPPPQPSESSWLIRHQFWSRRWVRKRSNSANQLTFSGKRHTNYLNSTYAINGHLYDNISYADSPLLRSLTCKTPEPQAGDPKEKLEAFGEREFCFGKFRILLACFVLLGITLANYSRNALSLAAVGMIASNAINRELVDILANDPTIRLNANATNTIQTALDGSCPIYSQPLEITTGMMTSDNSIGGPFIIDTIIKPSGQRKDMTTTTTSSSQQERALTSAKRKNDLEMEFKATIRRRIESGELVDWTPGEQGLISAAGSVGNLLIAIPLTRLGEIYGPKWIIFVASLGSVIQAAFMPIVSSCHLLIVLAFQLVFNGLTYGADCVAYTLFAHWLTPTEMAFFVSCLIICYQLGTMISSFVTAKILSQGIAWSWCFYTPAILCGVWTLIWMLIGASEPLKSRHISRGELNYLMKQSKISQTLNNLDSKEKADETRASIGSHPVAWNKLARDPNIWAIIAVKFTLRWYFSAYLSLMPTYLFSVGHMSVDTIGKMSVVQSFIGLFSGILMGYLTKSLVTKRMFDLSLATTRKCFQSIVNFGLALSLVVFIFYDCNPWGTIISLTFGGFCITFYVAAALQIPLDLSPTHCGLITSITNTLALGQALGAPVSGLILNDGPKDRARWRIVWVVAIVMNTLSGLIFILLVDSKPRDYNKYPASRSIESNSELRDHDARLLHRIEPVALASEFDNKGKAYKTAQHVK